MGLKDLDFDQCWERRASATIGEIVIQFISIDDLIFNKQLTERPHDLRDVEILKLKKSE